MKSQSSPESIPAAFASDDILTRAYRAGWNHGHGIACHNVPALGSRVFTDADGRQTVDTDNVRDIHANVCHEAASNARQFSPFEFLASELNSLGEGDDTTPSADDAWEAFEQGESDAIAADLATYTDEDYGIPAATTEEGEA